MIEVFDWNDIMANDNNDLFLGSLTLIVNDHIMQECVTRKVLPLKRNLPWLKKKIKSVVLCNCSRRLVTVLNSGLHTIEPSA